MPEERICDNKDWAEPEPHLDGQHRLQHHRGAAGQHLVGLLGDDVFEIFQSKLNILDQTVGRLGCAKVARNCEETNKHVMSH